MKPVIFAFDFSMNKPAMCAYINDEIEFYVWPSKIDKTSMEALQNADIHVFDRELPAMKDGEFNEHTLICEHVNRAVKLAGMISNKICDILQEHIITSYEDVIIANEGFAFGSHGDAVLDLSGYKYILMHALMTKGFTNFKTYAPTTIKSTAGCCKKGMGKNDMITKLGEEDNSLHTIFNIIGNAPEQLKKKTNFVMCVDDIADSYWCLKTVIKKENI